MKCGHIPLGPARVLSQEPVHGRGRMIAMIMFIVLLHVAGWGTHSTPTKGCLAPRAGFEPATIRLTVECSTAELPRNKAKPKGGRERQRITKPSGLAKEEIGGSGAASIKRGNQLYCSGLLPFPAKPALRPDQPPCFSAVVPFDRLDAKSTHSPTTLGGAGCCKR
jgi:hypothetical protein